MVYDFRDRLRHTGKRMQQVNHAYILYTGIRNGQTYTLPLEHASPILVSSDEITPGNASTTRLEYQDWALNVTELQNLYPPIEGDKITNKKTNERFTVASMGMDEPPYQHTTSDRERVLVHSHRDNRGF